MCKKRIIFKFDDFERVTRNVLMVDKIIKRFNIRVGWGCIGCCVQRWAAEDIAFVQSSITSGAYFFWNHGWSHADKEFLTYDVVEVQHFIQKTNDVVEAKTGYCMTAFGAPCNAIAESTARGLDHVSQIKYWFFGRADWSGKTIRRNVEMEYPLFRPRLLKFLYNYYKSQDTLLVLQGHPNAWKKFDFFNFFLICVFLKLNKAEFVSPEWIEKHE